jgi:hypothetical protein
MAATNASGSPVDSPVPTSITSARSRKFSIRRKPTAASSSASKLNSTCER